ncbi:MAG: hypothetical protein KDK99_07660 [Verrucomicrobiales bacterium]|nr:hypothetical protein [Verrucomicrobiales bacterium]
MSNKRVRPTRLKTAQELLHGPAQPRAKSRQFSQRSRHLDDEIHRLECVIAAVPQMDVKRRLTARNTLPPADEIRRRAPRRLPMSQRQQQRRQRTGQLIQLGVLLLLVAATAGWLKQWLQL